MHNPLRFMAVALVAMTAFAFNASAAKNLGDISIDANFHSTPVSVSGSPASIDTLANVAFNTDGAFRRVVPASADYLIRFTEVGASQVQVNVTRRDGSAFFSQVADGTSSRNALFRAADLAVKAITGAPGFFSDRLTFISNYSGHSEVFTSDLFFGDIRQITRDKSQAMTPRWSPDGRKIIYTSYYQSGFPNIYLIDLDRRERTVFAQFKGTNSGARFSPDGSQVAMVISGSGIPEIYVSNAQGRQVSQRTYSHAVQASPCWSPDGSQLVFTSDAAGGPQLYVMPSSGGQARRLPTRISGYCAEPDWSRANPDLIAFTAGVGHGFQIAVYDFSGKNPTKIVSSAPADALNPAWLGDGRHLVYTARAAGSRSLYILDTVTGKSTRISPSSMREVREASVWSPRASNAE